MIYKKNPLPNFPLSQRNALRPIDDLLLRYLNEQDLNLAEIFKNGVSFSDNLDGESITFTSSGTPDDENTIAHSLGRIPSGFIITNIDKAALIYKGTTGWDEDNIYLKVNVATVAVTILVF